MGSRHVLLVYITIRKLLEGPEKETEVVVTILFVKNDSASKP